MKQSEIWLIDLDPTKGAEIPIVKQIEAIPYKSKEEGAKYKVRL